MNEETFEIPPGTVKVVLPVEMRGTMVFLDAEGRETMRFIKTGIESLTLPVVKQDGDGK